MAGSWYMLANQMNTMFNATNVGNTGKGFRLKHGNKGNGVGGTDGPYRFGKFAVGSVPAANQPQWLIDTGTRHWDATSIKNIEDAVIDSLTQPPGQEYSMNFKLDNNNTGPTATADVNKQTVNGVTQYNITIHCPP